MLPLFLPQVKDFPRAVDQIFEDIETYNHENLNSPNYISLIECKVILHYAYASCRTLIRSFCDNITERTISCANVASAVSHIQRISRSFEEIRTLIQLNRSEALIPKINCTVSKFNSLKNALNIEFFKPGPVNNTNIHMIDEYHDMALKIKSDSESNPLTTGKILSSIQASIDELQRNPASNPFIAVVGPFFTEKIQLAFILALLQPIIYINFSGGQQPVYSLFSHLANEILNILRLDLKDFDLNHVGTFGPGSDALNGVYKYKKYGILGCFMAMYEKCASLDFTDANFNWMKFYTELGSFTFVKLSISEFVEKKSKSNECLVLTRISNNILFSRCLICLISQHEEACPVY